MENEWRERKSTGKANESAPKKDVGDKGRAVLEGLQGNVYRERTQEQVTYTTGEEPKKRRKVREEAVAEPKGNVLREKSETSVNELKDKQAKNAEKEAKDKKKKGPAKRPNILVQVLNR